MTLSLRMGRRLKRHVTGGRVPSLREVCLIGRAKPTRAWTEGDRVTFSGRLYRVGSTPNSAYFHLVAEAEPEPG